jgi:hypothetical protein
MTLYEFDESLYKYAKNNPDKIAWKDFAEGIKDFADYHCIANPYLIRGSSDHIFWANYFNKVFGKNCTFPYIVRLVNSYLIAGQHAQLA